MISDKSIKSPEELTELMRNLWEHHKAGKPQAACNVFMVELPPLTQEEEAEALCGNVGNSMQPADDELYGAPI